MNENKTHVTITPMFSSRNRPSAFPVNLLPHFGCQILPHVCTCSERRECYRGHCVSMCFNESSFTFIPGGEQLRGRCSTNEAWVRDTGETHARDVAWGGVDTCMIKRQNQWKNRRDGERGNQIPLRSQIALAALLSNSRAEVECAFSYMRQFNMMRESDRIGLLHFLVRRCPVGERSVWQT